MPFFSHSRRLYELKGKYASMWESEAGMEELFQKIMVYFRGAPDIFYYLVIGGAIILLGWWSLCTHDPHK